MSRKRFADRNRTINILMNNNPTIRRKEKSFPKKEVASIIVINNHSEKEKISEVKTISVRSIKGHDHLK